MSIRVTHSIDDLADDMRGIAVRSPGDMKDVVRQGIKAGNMVAKDLARESSRKHAKLYPGTFTANMYRGGGLFGNTYSGEYGPEPRGQGNLAGILENGSRNNPPHLNLARSADLIGPSFAQEVRALPDKWFW